MKILNDMYKCAWYETNFQLFLTIVSFVFVGLYLLLYIKSSLKDTCTSVP